MTPIGHLLITGASRGIGRALALEYIRRSPPRRLTLVARDAVRLEETASECRAHGSVVDVRLCDVADQRAWRSVLSSIDDSHPLDAVVLNAGTGGPEWMSSFTAEGFDAVYRVNTLPVAVTLEIMIPRMRSRGSGTIVGVGSLADARGYPGSASYCASKTAAASLLESARVELRGSGIHVLTVKPGFVRTDMTARNEFRMPWMIEPEKAARIIRRGIDRRRPLITFPFPIALATRIIRMLPVAVFDRLARSGRPERHR